MPRLLRLSVSRSWFALLAVILLNLPAQAKNTGGDPATCEDCPFCCFEYQMSFSFVSLTEGNASEDYQVARVKSAFGSTLDFKLTYNTYNADTSRASLDTMVGFGWTHSFNDFLFAQGSDMFRMRGDGRITRYALGTGGTYQTSPGYFESLVKNPDGSFDITTKYKTRYHYQSIAGTPFLVRGPVLRLTSITDRNNNVTTLAYTSGNLTSVTDTYGRAFQLGYNAGHHLVSITDPAGNVTTISYNLAGCLISAITDPAGRSRTYAYNALFQMTSMVDRDGRKFTFQYKTNLPYAELDSNGARLYALSNPLNWAADPAQLALTYMRVYLPSTTSKTDGRGNVWQYAYNGNGQSLSVTAPDGATSTYSYDPATLKVSSITDANGHVTGFQYDSQGNLTRRTDALGHVTTYTYESVFIGPILWGVPAPNRRVGTPPTIVAPRFDVRSVELGADPLENPSGVITNFGLLSTGTPTEPDENLYLQFAGSPGGPTPGYDYGRHFLFQGHENSGNLAYVTRINLDITDPAHRVTLLTPVDNTGLTNFNSIDGSTYDPFSNTMFFTQEAGSNGGVIEISTTWPPTVHTLYGILGRGGFEGIHPDDLGNLLIIEDVGGVGVKIDPTSPRDSPKVAKQPNSFVYRFLPTDPTNISAGGVLQALRVTINGAPIVFHASDPVGDTFSQAQLDLHTLGTSYPVDWVTIHDTAVDGTASFDANAAAKAAGATPFKRPENAQFLPGAGFQTFFFCPTGDTDSRAGFTPALAQRGSWGSIFRVDLAADRNIGTISIFFLGDAAHASFDNLTFSDPHTLLATEDRGDLLHTQLNRLDSVWAFATDGSAAPRRFIALGRDQASVNAGEDNEPTGLHVSVGSTSAVDMPGTLNNLVNPRAFVTRQHGDNRVWEILKHK